MRTSLASVWHQTVITATTSPNSAPNSLVHVQFGAAENARIDITSGPNNSPGGITFTPEPNVPSVTFVTRRQAAGSFRIPFTVRDACGDWSTFVGGGAGV